MRQMMNGTGRFYDITWRIMLYRRELAPFHRERCSTTCSRTYSVRDNSLRSARRARKRRAFSKTLSRNSSIGCPPQARRHAKSSSPASLSVNFDCFCFFSIKASFDRQVELSHLPLLEFPGRPQKSPGDDQQKRPTNEPGSSTTINRAEHKDEHQEAFCRPKYDTEENLQSELNRIVKTTPKGIGSLNFLKFCHSHLRQCPRR